MLWWFIDLFLTCAVIFTFSIDNNDYISRPFRLCCNICSQKYRYTSLIITCLIVINGVKVLLGDSSGGTQAVESSFGQFNVSWIFHVSWLHCYICHRFIYLLRQGWRCTFITTKTCDLTWQQWNVYNTG